MKNENGNENGENATEEKASRWTAKSLISLKTNQGNFGYFVKQLSVALRNNRGADGKATDKKGIDMNFLAENGFYRG